MVAVTVKWGKQKFESVEIDTSSPVELFKAQLYALTQVPPERQKIMGVKGGTLKDDANMEALGIKKGQMLMLVGSAESVPEPPPVQTVFVEDMPESEKRAMTATNPGGLTNLGNTCYLNSSLQCLRYIPELSTSLQKFVQEGSADDSVVFSMRDLVAELDRSNSAQEVTPLKFVSVFRRAFPMFAQRTENGQGFQQQDAEECFSTLVTTLSQRMKLSVGPEPSNIGSGAVPLLPRMEALKRNIGDMLFGIEMESTYTNTETEAEPAYTAREKSHKVACHISERTAHLFNAIEESLEEKIEKKSALLDRESVYKKESKIARLPPYLAVQFVRFAWRKDTNKRAKILRPVSFPDVLDVRNLCTPKLQASINAHCSLLEDEQDKAPAAGASDSAAPMETEGASSSAEAPAAAVDLKELAAGAEGAGYDNKTGRYELFGIITHQGRTAEGGHYVAWIKRSESKWLVFDDETVAEVDAERVKELHGGSGDWHIAYMCLFRKMDTPSLPKEKKEAKQA